MLQRRLLLSFILLMVTASTVQAQDDKSVVLEEAFHTDRDVKENVDSPAVWHGPDGQHWLLATAKEGDAILVFDATDGSKITEFGTSGTAPGEFDRPNGIATIDNLLLVVERNNKRIQVLQLPEFKPLGFLTHGELRRPYGLTVFQSASNAYELYVTDNYNPALEGYPPVEELDERIHHFRFSISNDMVKSQHINVFGKTTGRGILHKVESIWADPHYNRLMIADEAYAQRRIKVYDLDGNFTGKTISNKYFDSEPEGIALYRCQDGSGYWIMTDQHENEDNAFHVFDRKTLEHLGSFKGKLTRNTDGVWLSQRDFGPFVKGAFYPVHDDGSVTAISWAAIARALNLSGGCTIR